MHTNKKRDDLLVVESYLAPADMEVNKQVIRKGTWMMATLVLSDEIWKDVKAGKITGYSIGGTAHGKTEEAN